MIECNGLEIHPRQYTDLLYGDRWRCSIKVPGCGIRVYETQSKVYEEAMERARKKCSEMSLEDALAKVKVQKEKERLRKKAQYEKAEKRSFKLTIADLWLRGRV